MTGSKSGTPSAGPPTRRRWQRRSPESRRTSPRTSEEAEMGTATHRVVGPRETVAANTAAGRTGNLSYVPQEHEPVLAEELVDLLDPRPGETFVDATFGG